MTITELVRLAFEGARCRGFHDRDMEFGTSIALIHSELSEALEADRLAQWADLGEFEAELRKNRANAIKRRDLFEKYLKDSVEDELADAVIRIADMCGAFGIDLERHVVEKLEYNRHRPRKHGKVY